MLEKENLMIGERVIKPYNRKSNIVDTREFLIAEAVKRVIEKNLIDKDITPKEVTDIVETIHNFQFKDIADNIKNYTELEIGGFGTMVMSAYLCKKMIAYFESYKQTLMDKKTSGDITPLEEETKIPNTIKDIEYLYKKLKQYEELDRLKNQYKTNNGGLEESSNTSR